MAVGTGSGQKPAADVLLDTDGGQMAGETKKVGILATGAGNAQDVRSQWNSGLR